MKRILSILLFLPMFLQSQVTNFSFAPIPFTAADYRRPLAGPEKWHNMGPGYFFPYTFLDGTTDASSDYLRTGIGWNLLEPSQGTYNFSRIATALNAAIARNQTFSFNIMALYPGNPEGTYADGGSMTYPLYVHQRMQADGGNNTDWLSGSTWVPNWNHTFFLSRAEALLQAFAQWLQQNSFNGVPYWKAIGYVDIGIFGCWGEWNHSGIFGGQTGITPPAGRIATASSLIRIVNAHINAFPNYPLVAIMHAFDANTLSNVLIPAEVGYYVLKASNAYGKIGWKRMNWGRGFIDGYIPNTTINNPTVYNGFDGPMRFDTAISNRWRYAIVNGEGPNYDTRGSGPFPFYSAVGEVRLYHQSQLANGNFTELCGQAPVCAPQGTRDSIYYAFKLMGYRDYLTGGSMPTTVQAGVPFNITLNWRNDGVAPVYQNWNVQFELRNASNQAVWTGTSRMNLRSLLPGTQVITDQLSMNGVAAGTYSLVMIIRDPNGYRQPFPLGQYGRQSDGSYVLRSSMTVVGGSGMVVVAGADVSYPAGTTTIGLAGNATGGFVNTWAWTQIEGPSAATITPGSNFTATVSGLVAGFYTFRLQVNNAEFDDIVVEVRAPVAPKPRGFTLYLPIKPANP